MRSRAVLEGVMYKAKRLSGLSRNRFISSAPRYPRCPVVDHCQFLTNDLHSSSMGSRSSSHEILTKTTQDGNILPPHTPRVTQQAGYGTPGNHKAQQTARPRFRTARNSRSCLSLPKRSRGVELKQEARVTASPTQRVDALNLQSATPVSPTTVKTDLHQ